VTGRHRAAARWGCGGRGGETSSASRNAFRSRVRRSARSRVPVCCQTVVLDQPAHARFMVRLDLPPPVGPGAHADPADCSGDPAAGAANAAGSAEMRGRGDFVL